MDAVLCGTSTASGTSRTAAGMPTFPLEEQDRGNSGQQQNKEKKICQIHFISPSSYSQNQPSNLEDHKGNQISHGSLEQCGAKSTLHRTEFSPGSSKCCNTGHVQHCEYQERESSQCRREYHVQHGGKFSVSGSTGQNGKGADNGFFCCNSSNQCGGLSVTRLNDQSKLCKNQITMEARKMMVNALRIKSFAFSHMWSKTLLADGIL